MPRIYIYDTTLRDGAQTEGISFSLEDKRKVVECLDNFGIDFIEGGMPTSNPTDNALFSSGLETKKSKLVAFGSTCRPCAKPSDDDGLKALADCSSEWVCIFGKAWDFHVTNALGTTLDENIRIIRESIEFLKSKGKSVIFDAEHFFDGYMSDREYAMKTIEAAAKGGADWIVLCDTNGGNLPDFIGKTTKTVSESFDRIGIHCHNDSETAVANTIAAVTNGATMVQGTINGYGERCGNANLCSLLPNLKMKMNCEIPVNLTNLTDLSLTISELANETPRPYMPYVGRKAFSHKGGMHISAMVKDLKTYEHISPESVGNRRTFLVSDMSGRASVSNKLRELGLDVDNEQLQNILDEIKEMEFSDYRYENADASFKLLADRIITGSEKPFRLEEVEIDMNGNAENFVSEVNTKVSSPKGDTSCTSVKSDNGPVNALDMSLRTALSKIYPEIVNVRLIDYKVRVLDEKAGTEARVRVLITSTDGKTAWNTVGVSENVIEASLIALSDSYEYAITIGKTGRENNG